MGIRVTHPSGATVEFPDGTDPDTIAGAMGQLDGRGTQAAGVGGGNQPATPATPERAPYSSFGEVATGAAKALGTGVVKGAIGLGTLPGNVEALARAGINRGAGLLGVEGNVVDPDTLAINYNDLAGRVQNRFGEFYKPQTTPERYIETVGSFLPGGVMAKGATAGQRAAQVVAPAVTSETAGQLTEGTAAEPWARVAGALAGGAAANLGARTITPAPAEPVKTAAVKELAQDGVTAISAGQKTGNPTLRWMESAAQTMPGGRRMAQVQEQQAEQFTAAALKTAGLDATRATPEVLNQGFARLGQMYDTVEKVARVTPDASFAPAIRGILNTYRQRTAQTTRLPIVEEFGAEILNKTLARGGMDGTTYRAIVRSLKDEARSLSKDPQASRALYDLALKLDAQMIRSAPRNIRPQVAQYIRDLNEKYSNLLVLEKAASRGGEQVALGLITPAGLKTAMGESGRRAYARGRGKLAKLARSGEAVIKPLPSSGTAERGMAQSILKAPATLVGSGFGAGGFMMGADPVTTIAMALGPLLAQAGAARALTNPTMQRYLSNQTLTTRVNPAEARNVGSLMAPQILQQYGSQPQDIDALAPFLPR